MLPTAMSMKPSATSSGSRGLPVARSISIASAVKRSLTSSRSSGLLPRGPKTCGNQPGWI
jgi:hypothetical protein